MGTQRAVAVSITFTHKNDSSLILFEKSTFDISRPPHSQVTVSQIKTKLH